MNRAIKVLHTEWSDGWGGQEIRIINEMIAVREQGLEVFLACRSHSIIRKKALENNIQVFILPFRGNADFKTLFALKGLIKKHSIDIVNTHSGKDTWVGGLAAKFSGAKFIRTRHLSNRIRSSRTNFINELADYIFTTGESIRSDMIKYNRVNPEKIQSIPTGIDTDLFDPDEYNKQACRKQFDIQDDEIVIGIIAVLRQFKRHDLFLQMAKTLIEQYPKKKLVFLIAGEGPQKENIIDWINKLDLVENVKLLGHIDNVPELLSALDIFVLSSDSKEGVPQSVMQALLMNKAVISTDSGSTKDLFYQNNFQSVRTNSVSSLTNGVIYYLKQEKVKNTRRFIVSNFSKIVMVKKIMNIYKELVS
ncbi:glycosyltransferase [Candidatus Woesearchaeota archaeon]|nr:glycosyltransferase [Candidatus Woesearchaeota archaeon]